MNGRDLNVPQLANLILKWPALPMDANLTLENHYGLSVVNLILAASPLSSSHVCSGFWVYRRTSPGALPRQHRDHSNKKAQPPDHARGHRHDAGTTNKDQTGGEHRSWEWFQNKWR